MTSKEYDGPTVFFVNTETYKVTHKSVSLDSNKVLKPIEISILDRLGKKVLSTTVDY